MPYKSRDGDFEPSNAHERILILFDVLRITKELVVLFPPPPPHQTFIPALIIDPPLPLSPSEGKKERKRERKRERNKKKTVAFRRLFPLPRFKEWREGGWIVPTRTVHFRREEFIHFPRGGSEFRRNGAAPLARGTSICKENSRPK